MSDPWVGGLSAFVVPDGHAPMRHAEFARIVGVAPNTFKQWVRAGLPTGLFGVEPRAALDWILKHRPDSIAIGRTSLVYFAKRGDGLIKIGFTSDLARRLRELAKESGQGVEIVATVKGDSIVEAVLHRVLDALHVEHEWFRPEAPLVELINALDRPEGGAFLASIQRRFDRLNQRQRAALNRLCAGTCDGCALRTLQSLAMLGHASRTSTGWEVDDATRESWAAWKRFTGAAR